ncbi:hypothetical protein PG993_011726 [Apiospora rasikravindrae]|uniref:Uncharacterized protein n=1 Tax=Apiospora rasikravindrae TaxID=990691 RepID=A0ABR1S1W2_9PEZI
MPVIVRPKPGLAGTTSHSPAADGRTLLHRTSSRDSQREVFDTSVSEADHGSVVPYNSGFIETILRAWQQDMHLELRPDDVWLGVLTQLSFFVNGRAEALRSHFVTHEGQHRLLVDCTDCKTIKDVDVAFLTERLVGLARDRLVDPGLADWLLPGFTTTLAHDRTVAAAVFLGTIQQYFRYEVMVCCGFPSVTLHGERSDWVALTAGVTRLAGFAGCLDDEDADSLRQWSRCLEVAIGRMVDSFDRPDDADVREFWMRSCHSTGEGGSGETVVLSGWLTAFAWWRADGARQRSYTEAEVTELRQCSGRADDDSHDGPSILELGGVKFPVIKQDELPAGVTRTPITFHHGGGSTDATLLAGSSGMRLMDETRSRARPFSSWWLLGAPLPHPPRESDPQPTGRNKKMAASNSASHRTTGLVPRAPPREPRRKKGKAIDTTESQAVTDT